MHQKLMAAVLATSLSFPMAYAQNHDHAMHMQHMQQAPEDAAKPAKAQTAQAAVQDTRQVVHFPKTLRAHTLANMRDHLLALQQIQQALAQQEYDQAGDIAEQRLGMTSLGLHGAHEAAKYMPKGMQAIGSNMHRSASRFAVAAKDAGATGDMKPVLEALANVTAQCVACHAGYRVK